MILIQDLLARAHDLTGLEWIAQRKNGFYYLFNVDHTGAYACYLLVQRFDSILELRTFLEDLIIIEEEIQS